MTGFDSKRKIALDKLDDDDIQVYAHPAQEPVICKHEWFRTGAMEMGECRCIKCGAWNSTKPAAQPAQEPVDNDFFKSLAKKNQSPDQRPWIGLTDEEITKLDMDTSDTMHDFVYAVESALRSKNT